MKDYHNKWKRVEYLGLVTGEVFEKRYNQMSESDDKIPIASTIIRHENDMKLVEAWIFYEQLEIPVNKPIKKKLRMEL